MIKYLTALVITLFILGCKTKSPIINDIRHVTPPNGLMINDLTYIDKTEMTNIGWKEYVFYIGQLYGKESRQYRNTLPDTTIWYGQVEQDTFMVHNYYQNERFDLFPVVGITQQQTMLYSKWRADRVFQMYLIDAEMIDFHSATQPENDFTIEKYLAGTYRKYLPDSTLTHIPHYRLPEFNEVLRLTSSTSKIKLISTQDPKVKNAEDLKTEIEKDLQLSIPFLPEYADVFKSDAIHVRYIMDNVNEWSMSPNMIYGSENSESNPRTLIHRPATVKALVGFRNIFYWKPVKR